MSNLGFTIENNYAATQAMRRSRIVASSEIDAEARRITHPQPETPYRLFFIAGLALVLATAYAFPDQAAMLLHSIGAN